MRRRCSKIAILGRCLLAALPLGFEPPAINAQQIVPRDQVRNAAPGLITTRFAGIELKLLPADEFLMGSTGEDKQLYRDEKPQHRVRITRPFYLGVYEITQAQYQLVTGVNPSSFSTNGRNNVKVFGLVTDRYPIEQVSWLDAVAFCNKLSERERLAPFKIDGEKVGVGDWNALGYRLPTEAEWEYACRGAVRQSSLFCFGDDASRLGEFAWFDDNSDNRTHTVGEKRPNGFGLFDTHGNVEEWCWDRAGRDYYERSPREDPRGPDRAMYRVKRGRCWFSDSATCRSAFRDGIAPKTQQPFIGFRIARGHSGH
jgi:formylglycine-generating enzyme required for sulfatase activity